MGKEGDYDAVKRDIIAILKQPGYDDGSIGPLLVRLAWHAAGTYDKLARTGGANGGTMRFEPESKDPANAGLEKARTFMEKVKADNPWISYGDLWTLGGVTAVEALGGPIVPWKPGRVDVTKEQIKAKPDRVPKHGNLPDASQGAAHLRHIFNRMGFNDREIVALSGAHALGRCHKDRSGYDGPWTFTPTRFSNQYYKLLLGEKWSPKKWDGPLQYEDSTGELMMLPTDLSLVQDEKFKAIVQEYANDKDLFFKDFAVVYAKLMSLGWQPDSNPKL